MSYFLRLELVSLIEFLSWLLQLGFFWCLDSKFHTFSPPFELSDSCHQKFPRISLVHNAAAHGMINCSMAISSSYNKLFKIPYIDPLQEWRRRRGESSCILLWLQLIQGSFVQQRPDSDKYKYMQRMEWRPKITLSHIYYYKSLKLILNSQLSVAFLLNC